MIIAGGIAYRVIESVRHYRQEMATRPKTRPKPQPVGRPTAFNVAKSTSRAGTFEFSPNLWIGLAAVVGVLVLGYFCYSILMTPKLDADGHPVALSWWVWPLFLLFIFAAAAAYPLFKMLRENMSTASRPTTRPTVAPKTTKPVGFNTALKQKTVSKASGGSWQLPSLPKIEGLGEVLPMVGIGAVALIGLLIVVYIGYSLSTMEWIDADGHPVPMPWWIVPLLIVLAALGVVGYKIFTSLQDNSGGTFRSSSARPTPAKTSKPTGFNAAGFGQKKGGFNRPQGGQEWYTNPMLWVGILGCMIGLLFLVIVLMLVF